MRLAAITAVWKRAELTDLVLAYYAAMRRDLAGRLELEVVVAGSEGAASREMAERHGCHYVEVDNMPLNRKFNAACRAARAVDPDAVMVFGSDSLLSQGFLLRAAERVGDGLYATNQGFQFDLQRWQLGIMEREFLTNPSGNGRTLARTVLNAVDWHPWPQRAYLSHNLDGNSSRKLAARGFVYHNVEPLGEELNLNIRAGENITKRFNFRGALDYEPRPVAILAQRLDFCWLIELLKLREQLWPQRKPYSGYIPLAFTFHRFRRWLRARA